jgi:predicted transcriptional regulator
VIQPAVGWAKYLELPEDEVTEFLVGLLGESKRKDVEKGWKYVRELEFTVPESVKWAGKTREEWEGEVIAYLQFRREVSRQELLKEVFANQKWLCDMIMDGLASKGIVTFDFVVHGRGRPRKVYRLAEEVRIPLRKAVGCEEEIFYLINNQEKKVKVFQGVSLSREERKDFSQNTNSPVRRAMGGRLDIGGISGSNGNTGIGEVESVNFYGEGRSDGFRKSVKEKGEGRNKESVPNLTAAVKFEIPPELRNLMQEAEQAQKERNLQRLAKMFAKARWYEVELPSLLELYRKDKELGRLLERVLLLSGRRIDDTVRRVSKVLLLQCQREFVERYLKLRPIQPIM